MYINACTQARIINEWSMPPGPYFFPGSCWVGFTGGVHGVLELAQVDKSGRQTSKIRNVVKEDLGGFIHALIVATLSNLIENN